MAQTDSGKFSQLRDALKPLNLALRSLADIQGSADIEIEENGQTARENAQIKATTYAQQLNIITLAMDNGLYLTGLPDEFQPGIYVRRIYGEGDYPRPPDRELLAYYSGLVTGLGGKADGHWEFAVCIAAPTGQIFETTLREPRSFVSKPSLKSISGVYLCSRHNGTFGAICPIKQRQQGRNLMGAENHEQPEEMASFFDLRAAGYDAHMRENIFSDREFTQFYQALSLPIEKSQEPLNILDLGCGTGLEIEALLQRVPNALITGVDLSSNMLEELKKRYATHMDQITLIADSYLTMSFETQAYDHVISAMSMHHLLHDTKRNLYEKIYASLKPSGKYIEGDSVTFTEMEGQFLAEYHQQVAGMPQAEDGHYHIDVPFSIDTQRSLLLEAGFGGFEVVWEKDSTAVWNVAVYAVRR